MTVEYQITLGAEVDKEEVFRLYRSLVGTEGCTWNLDYPTMEDVDRDIRKQTLYILRDGARIIAAASAGEDNDLTDIDCFTREIRRPCELSRLGVDSGYQHQGIARRLLLHIEEAAMRQGFDGIRLIVSRTNPRALALYQGLGYSRCGECRRYELDWYCCEKPLRP